MNTDFGHDIIVIPVDDSFMLSPDLVGSAGGFGGLDPHQAITTHAGITIAPGDPGNPTSAVWVIYDTSDNGGQGYCVPKEGGGKVGVSAVILYHELSHALRDATDTTLDHSDTWAATPTRKSTRPSWTRTTCATSWGSVTVMPPSHCPSSGCAVQLLHRGEHRQRVTVLG